MSRPESRPEVIKPYPLELQSVVYGDGETTRWSLMCGTYTVLASTHTSSSITEKEAMRRLIAQLSLPIRG